jgi:hypothetical protein
VAALLFGGLGVMARKGRSTSTELEQLRAEIATLKDRAPSERTVIVREVPGAPGAPPATATPPIPAAPDAPGTREEQERRAKAVQQAMEHLYGETYLREPEDPQWAQAAARTIRDRYTGKDFQGLEVLVECKKTICRMDFTFPEGDQGLTATHKLVETDPWPCQRYTRVEGEDHVGFMFISRQGSNLPALDPKTVTF